MKTPQRVMAVLRAKGLNETVIRYAHLIGRLFKPKQIFFVHPPGTPDVPEEILDRYPTLAEPGEGPVQGRMRHLVEAHFKPPPDCQVLLETLKGHGVVELLRFSWKRQIDLVLVEKNVEKDHDAHDLQAEKIARKAPCPVLLVPSAAKPMIKKILVPVDFSQNSQLALEAALRVASAAKIKDIAALHVYHVPVGFARTGKSYEEFSIIMEDNARFGYESFIDRVETGNVDVTPLFLQDENPAASIQTVVKTQGIDLLVIGNKGKQTSLLLGSVSERLIRITQVPLLVAKRKGLWINLIKILLSWKF
jgi:nucleotide-binding universal stress UspA family protein